METSSNTRIGYAVALIGVVIAIVGLVIDDGMWLAVVGAVLVVAALAFVAYARRPARASVSTPEAKAERLLHEHEIDPHQRARADYTGT
jgi:O-antigen/teichoic acid export membrane protein